MTNSSPASRPLRNAISALVAGSVCLVLFLALTVGYTTYAVRHSEQQWCTTIALLTKTPVPNPGKTAAKNPSREEAYVLYTDFLTLRHDFGCSG